MVDFPKIGDGFPLNRWQIFSKTEPLHCPKPEPFFLLEQSQSSPKMYFLLLLQFRISAQSKRIRAPERRTVCHNCSPDFPWIFHLKLFFLLSFHTGKSQNDNGTCVHKAIRQTNHHFHELLIVFATPFCVCATFG